MLPNTSGQFMKRISFGLTDTGCVRESNQDSFLIHEAEGLYVVADGMGGHAAGEIASSLAVKTVYDVYIEGDDPEATIADVSGMGDEMVFERLRYAVNRASQSIQNMAQRQPGCRGMGTTIVILAIDDRNAYIAHAGDSRAYLVRPEGLRRLTRDHTWIADQIRAGLITEAQAATSQYRNLLTRSVGLEPFVSTDCSSRRLEPGDRFVLCTDGLHGPVTDAEIYRVVLNHSPRAAAERLIALARERGAPDNVTVVVVAVEQETPPARRPRPILELDE